MIPERPLHPQGEVWICASCKMIGDKTDADAHQRQTGHTTERLPDDIAEAVRVERLRRHDEFIGGLIAAGRASQRPQLPDGRS